jgi:hypothetical protein
MTRNGPRPGRGARTYLCSGQSLGWPAVAIWICDGRSKVRSLRMATPCSDGVYASALNLSAIIANTTEVPA